MSKTKSKVDITSSVTITCRRQGFPSWLATLSGYEDNDSFRVEARTPDKAIESLARKVYRHIEKHHPGTEGYDKLIASPDTFKLTSMDEIRYTWNFGG